MPPRHRCRSRNNPHTDFVDHADRIRGTLARHVGLAPTEVEVLYGLGPFVEVTFGGPDPRRDPRFWRQLAESLHELASRDDLRTGANDVVTLFTPRGRQILRDGADEEQEAIATVPGESDVAVRHRFPCRIDPPTDFVGHADQIAHVFEHHMGVAAETVEVLYGLGPFAEIAITGPDPREQPQFWRLLAMTLHELADGSLGTGANEVVTLFTPAGRHALTNGAEAAVGA